MPLHSSVGSYLLGVLIEFAMDDAAVLAVKVHECYGIQPKRALF